jgi:hypothetical protein
MASAPSEGTLRVTLVRHAQPTTYATPDPPLHRDGRVAAARLADTLPPLGGVDAVLVSPLTRAVQTLATFLQARGAAGVGTVDACCVPSCSTVPGSGGAAGPWRPAVRGCLRVYVVPEVSARGSTPFCGHTATEPAMVPPRRDGC